MTSHPIKSVKFDKKGECVKCFVSMTFQWFLNPFLDNVPILYPLKTLKNLRFPGVFRIYKTRVLFINGFSIDSYKTLNENSKWKFIDYLYACKSLKDKVKRNFVNFITLRRYFFWKTYVPILLQNIFFRFKPPIFPRYSWQIREQTLPQSYDSCNCKTCRKMQLVNKNTFLK